MQTRLALPLLALGLLALQSCAQPTGPSSPGAVPSGTGQPGSAALVQNLQAVGVEPGVVVYVKAQSNDWLRLHLPKSAQANLSSQTAVTPEDCGTPFVTGPEAGAGPYELCLEPTGTQLKVQFVR